jgi:hypothetical protein
MIAALLDDFRVYLADRSNRPELRSALLNEVNRRFRALHPELADGRDEPADAALAALCERYTWTLDETADPGWISPALLGCLHEDLLIARESSGAFYTPPHLARIMCRRALVGILAEQSTLSADRIESLVHEGKGEILDSRQRASVVETLEMLRCVDPACGAGALLVQMFLELTRVARALGLGDAWVRDLPRRSLFGADLDPAALQIAQLRLQAAVIAATGQAADEFERNFVTGDSLAGPNPELPDAAEVSSPGIGWRTTFASIFAERGGFDVVLANPPYLRRERMSAELRRVRAQYSDAVDGRADLFCYFYVRGLQLLRDGGMQVFLCSNSWLDAGYGARLQRWLLERAHVQALIEPPAEKHFRDADVNTVISVLRKGRPTDNAPTQFISERSCGPLDAGSVITLPRAELWRRGAAGGAEYAGEKWGGLYLRAPRVFHRLLERSAGRLRKLSELAEVLGYIHDNNTGPAFPAARFVKSVRDLDRIALETDSPAIVDYGVNPAGNSRVLAPILFPRTFGARHLAVWNRAGIHGKEFYRVLPFDPSAVVPLCAQLNSTFGMLQREIIGLANLGEGALKFSARDVGLFDVLADLTEDEVAAAFVELSQRPQLPPEEELQQPDRRELDRCLFDRLGLDGRDRAEIYEAVVSLIADRAARATRSQFAPKSRRRKRAAVSQSE